MYSSLEDIILQKKNFSYAGLFLKIHIMVDDVVVYSFFFFLKKKLWSNRVHTQQVYIKVHHPQKMTKKKIFFFNLLKLSGNIYISEGKKTHIIVKNELKNNSLTEEEEEEKLIDSNAAILDIILRKKWLKKFLVVIKNGMIARRYEIIIERP